LRASNIAVGDPPHRAPTTIASYSLFMAHPACSWTSTVAAPRPLVKPGARPRLDPVQDQLQTVVELLVAAGRTARGFVTAVR
jgi:hypothetical protein